MAPPYDAFLLVSFGGPEGPADVIPFLENVTAGRNVPVSGWSRWQSTTTGSAGSARSTSSAAI